MLEDLKIEKAEIVNVKDGDYFIVKIASVISKEQVERIKKNITEFFEPHEVKVLVLHGDLNYKILRAEDVNA